jgi:hypothetical protein
MLVCVASQLVLGLPQVNFFFEAIPQVNLNNVASPLVFLFELKNVHIANFTPSYF